MDVDWCLSCDRHLSNNSPAPYCSAICMPVAGPSNYYQEEEEEEEEMVHQIYYTGNDYSGIEQWASNVVPGAPEQQPPTPRSRASSSSRSSSPRTTLKPPSLLSARRPLPPALSFTPTAPKQPPTPSLPLNTTALPSSSYSSYSRSHSVAYSASTAQDSSALATPVSGNAYVEHVYGWSPSSKERMLPPPSKPIPAVCHRGRPSGRALA